MDDAKTHWEHVYRTKRADEVSWFQREPTISLDLVKRVANDRSSRIIDVGGGSSSLVDRLLDNGYPNVTVLDVSATALAQARARVGTRASRVQWLEADVTAASLPDAHFDVWHDRAVFHFLTNASDRAAYIRLVGRAVRPRGYVIIATFAEDGPTKCSGLPVVRYSSASLHQEFDGGFELIHSTSEQHVTPSGQTQSFIYCLCQFNPHAAHRAA
jgi:ubiquinone/menaquinone biosynthesis C-methylase UbiE